jgi:hypothetical protein
MTRAQRSVLVSDTTFVVAPLRSSLDPGPAILDSD